MQFNIRILGVSSKCRTLSDYYVELHADDENESYFHVKPDFFLNFLDAKLDHENISKYIYSKETPKNKFPQCERARI